MNVLVVVGVNIYTWAFCAAPVSIVKLPEITNVAEAPTAVHTKFKSIVNGFDVTPGNPVIVALKILEPSQILNVLWLLLAMDTTPVTVIFNVFPRAKKFAGIVKLPAMLGEIIEFAAVPVRGPRAAYAL